MSNFPQPLPRVLHVMGNGADGGAETAFVDTCLAQHEAGFSVAAVVRHNPLRVKRLKEAGIPTYILPFGTFWDIYTSWKLKKIIAAYQPQIVQTWMARAAQKVRRWNLSLGIPAYSVISRLGGYYKIKNFKNTDYFLAITPDIRRYLMNSGIPSPKVFHINNFASLEEAESPTSRQSLNTPSDAPLLLALGRLHPAKALDILLKALAQIPEAWLWIAGEGPLKKELEDLAKDLGIANRVRFLGWRNDRAALFQACNMCVFPSRHEPFGTVFIQAWAQKVPVIVSEAMGPRQYVRDGQDSLVVPIDNVDATAAAIRRLIDDKALVATLAQNGWMRYHNEFTKEKTIQAYADLYQKCTVQA